MNPGSGRRAGGFSSGGLEAEPGLRLDWLGSRPDVNPFNATSRPRERREARGERREARGERREARGERREARGERFEAPGW